MLHTPGPWKACRDGICRCGLITSRDQDCFIAKALGPGDIGEIDPVPGGNAQNANMVLISLAPELLEVCQDILLAYQLGHSIDREVQTIERLMERALADPMIRKQEIEKDRFEKTKELIS